ncbi:hypothetical protein [Flavobacterium sp.]|uniref:hypothetical protein n=1 Tax=Flavobacterium sp. TaxID=239 RepID=UPI0039E2D00D
MKLAIFSTIFFIHCVCIGQNIEVSVRNIYVDSTEIKNSIISSIQCETNSIVIDSVRKIKLIYAEGKDKFGTKYKIDDFDYFGYDDMVLKNTFPVTFITKKRIKEPLNISGKVRYFTPTIENGGIKIVENPKRNCNFNVLKNNYGIKVIVLAVDDFISVIENKKQFNRVIDSITSNNKLNKKLFKKCINLLVSDHQNYSWKSDQYFAIYIEDPNDQIVGIHTSINNQIVYDGGGIYRFSSSKLVTRRFRQNIEANRSLVFEIENPNSIKDYDFILSNISF